MLVFFFRPTKWNEAIWLRNNVLEKSLTLPMASVWCCVQICSLLTQCCLSLASVAERERGGSERWVSGYNLVTVTPEEPRHRFFMFLHQWIMVRVQINMRQSSRLGSQWVAIWTRNTTCWGATVAQDRQLTVRGLKVVWSLDPFGCGPLRRTSTCLYPMTNGRRSSRPPIPWAQEEASIENGRTDLQSLESIEKPQINQKQN